MTVRKAIAAKFLDQILKNKKTNINNGMYRYALFAVSPTTASNLANNILTNELSGSGYARVTTDNKFQPAVASNQALTAEAVISFPTATANWSTVSHIALLAFDENSTWNVIHYTALKSPVKITTGNSFTFAAGALGFYVGASKTLPAIRTETTVDFTTSGTWTCPAGVTEIEVALIGGGGSGGDSYGGGGGGAGGLIYRNVNVIPGNNYTITIGAGGATANTSGNASTAFGLTALGGGGGGTASVVAKSGASGAGGAGASTATYKNGASGDASQGNAGGAGAYATSPTRRNGGGGGGFTSPGTTAGVDDLYAIPGGMGFSLAISPNFTGVCYGGDGGNYSHAISGGAASSPGNGGGGGNTVGTGWKAGHAGACFIRYFT